MKLSHLLSTLVALLLLTSLPVVAQNLNTSNLSSSPYNRYGYGHLGSLGNAVTRSMGDVGIAIRSNQYTSLANPASLTAIDTLTMIFTMGLDAQYGYYTEGDANSSKWDAGFSGMSFQAPLWRNFAMSLSLSPYSMVGYGYGGSDETAIPNATIKNDTLTYAGAHQGVGGINNFMLGLGWRAFRNKWVEANIGVNVGWLFGTIEHSGTLVTSSQATGTYLSYELQTRGLYLELGAQYTQRIDANQSVTLGAIFQPKLNLSADTYNLKYSSDSISYSERFRSDVKLPMRWGVGLTYNYARKLTISAEYENTRWSQVKGFDATFSEAEANVFNDAQRISCGVEYQPKVLTNNYFMICRYRAGFSYKTSYLKVNGADLKEYGANLGMSFPVNKRSAFDFGVGYSRLSPSTGSMVTENYLTLNLGVTFNEMMFFRNRLR